MRVTALVALVAFCAAAVACASQMGAKLDNSTSAAGDEATVDAQATFPPGPQGQLIAYGYNLISDTPKYAGDLTRARMSCAACHPNAGRTPHAGSLLGIYAKFPQWNKRAQRFIALQDRIAECFLYSMNGKPPAYYSHEMIAITGYIAWLSRGAKTGVGFGAQEPPKLVAHAANVASGARLYAARCASCHGAKGDGMAFAFPPLWGPDSFNDKAGMSHMDRMAPFVRAAMPQDAPGTLTDQEATDIAAFVLSHPRPHFNKSAPVQFPPEKAGYF